jgi:small-conductance mechanosensitive channel
MRIKMMDWIKRSRWMLTVAAVLAAAAPALAQPGKPPTPPGAAKAAAGADKAAGKADKAADKADKAADKADKAADKADKAADKADKAENAADDRAMQAKHATKKAERSLKSKAEKATLRARVMASLKGHPMSQAMREEIKRNAQRLARLERIKDLAEDAKDSDAMARVDKLIAKESARHDRWMEKYDATADKAGAK